MCCRCRNVRSNAVGLPLNAPAPPHAPRDCARKQKDNDDPLPAAGQALHKCRRVGAGWCLQCYRRVCLVWRARTPASSSHALPLPLHFLSHPSSINLRELAGRGILSPPLSSARGGARCGLRSAGARIGTTGPRALLGFARSGGGGRIILSQSSSSHATSVIGADWPHVVAWTGLPAGNCATPPSPAGFSGISIPPLSRRPSPGPISSMTIFSSISLYSCVWSFEVTVPSLHPPHLCRAAYIFNKTHLSLLSFPPSLLPLLEIF